MESVCNETLKLLLSNNPFIDLNYPIEGYNLPKFYEVNCGGGSINGTGNFTNILQPSAEEEEELYDPEYYSHTYRIIGTFFQGVIFLVGLLGNIMVILTVAKTKSMHSPTNCYLVSLAIADIIVLLAAVPNEILSYYLIGGKWLYGEWGCSIFVFSQNLGINASTLSLTAFTVERYIAICHTMRAQTMCTVSRAKRIICAVWLCSLIYCSPWLGLTSLTRLPYRGYPDVKKCTFKLSREAYTYYYLTDFFVFYVVPLLLSVILYGLIARVLFQSHSIKTNNRSRTTMAVNSGGKSNNSHTSNGCSSGQLTVDSTKTNAARVQVVKMLVMVVVIFAVLWLPYRGMLVYNSFAPMFNKEVFMDLWFLMFVKTCIYINSAINPILYNAMSVKFRRAFSRTLFCGKSRSSSSFKTYYGRRGREYGDVGVGVGGASGNAGGRDHYTTYSTATCTTPPQSGNAATITMIPMTTNSYSNSSGGVGNDTSTTGPPTTLILSNTQNHHNQHSMPQLKNNNKKKSHLKANLLQRSQPSSKKVPLIVKKNGHHVQFSSSCNKSNAAGDGKSYAVTDDSIYTCTEDDEDCILDRRNIIRPPEEKESNFSLHIGKKHQNVTQL